MDNPTPFNKYILKGKGAPANNREFQKISSLKDLTLRVKSFFSFPSEVS
jgi:hypothetical protein